MRCFTFSDGNFEPGLRFHTVNGIIIGSQPVRFDNSLIFDSGCHFGQYIVNAVIKPIQPTAEGRVLAAGQARAAIALAAPPAGSASPAGGALLFVRIPVRDGSEIIPRETPGIARIVHGGERVERMFYRGSRRLVCCVWEALIEFSGPGEFRLKEEIVRRLSRMEKLTGIDPGFPVTRTVRVNFDGELFSSTAEQPQGYEPTVEATSYGMYDEQHTVNMIAEMIGNQERV